MSTIKTKSGVVVAVELKQLTDGGVVTSAHVDGRAYHSPRRRGEELLALSLTVVIHPGRGGFAGERQRGRRSLSMLRRGVQLDRATSESRKIQARSAILTRPG
jgi:hypothetical protein